MIVSIDNKSGFCWGVVRTVDIAEEQLNKAEKNNEKVYILGQIIHNPKEINRLEERGLNTVTISELENISKNAENSRVIIRAHGEPPSTYQKAKELGINLIDATCPLVTNLQNRVRKYHNLGYQIIIFGKIDHAEVIGLRGVCDDECIVIKNLDEAMALKDLSRKSALISQTTMEKPTFYKIKEFLESQINELVDIGEAEKLLTRDTTCRAVTSREEPLLKFAESNDVMIFVSGKKSSNGKSLFVSLKKVKEKAYFIEDVSEIDWAWFDKANTVGISGATSTPQWFLQQVKEVIESKFNN